MHSHHHPHHPHQLSPMTSSSMSGHPHHHIGQTSGHHHHHHHPPHHHQAYSAPSLAFNSTDCLDYKEQTAASAWKLNFNASDCLDYKDQASWRFQVLWLPAFFFFCAFKEVFFLLLVVYFWRSFKVKVVTFEKGKKFNCEPINMIWSLNFDCVLFSGVIHPGLFFYSKIQDKLTLYLLKAFISETSMEHLL